VIPYVSHPLLVVWQVYTAVDVLCCNRPGHTFIHAVASCVCVLLAAFLTLQVRDSWRVDRDIADLRRRIAKAEAEL
jgi:hypothetical protein